MKKEEELELEFRRGYYCAVANLVSMHGEGIEAVEVLRTYGEINFDGISEYDKERWSGSGIGSCPGERAYLHLARRQEA